MRSWPMLMQRGSTWYFRRTVLLALCLLMEGKREIWRSPSPALKASTRLAIPAAGGPRNPMRATFWGCARAASGMAPSPPATATRNTRRSIIE
jgi:hypothetical protein